MPPIRPARSSNFTRSSTDSYRSESDRHADVTARKAQPLVKALRVDAGVMRQKLEQLAAPRLGPVDRPLHQLLANTKAAAVGCYAHILDQTARCALRTQARQDAKLQAADDAPALLRHHEFDVRIMAQPLERLVIRRGQRILQPLPRAAEIVVCEHRND